MISSTGANQTMTLEGGARAEGFADLATMPVIGWMSFA